MATRTSNAVRSINGPAIVLIIAAFFLAVIGAGGMAYGAYGEAKYCYTDYYSDEYECRPLGELAEASRTLGAVFAFSGVALMAFGAGLAAYVNTRPQPDGMPSLPER